MSRLKIEDYLERLDKEAEQDDLSMWGMAAGGGDPSHSLFRSAKFRELVALLMAEPILVGPTLEWVKTKRAQMARKQLEVLYTPEQLEAMYAEIEKGK